MTCGQRISQMVTRPIRPSDWERFHHYSGRVRKFAYNKYHPKESNVSDEAFSVMNAAANGRSLLPNVTEWCAWQAMDHSNGIIPFAHLFISPNLRTLHISAFERTLIMLSFIANIGSQYPFLTTVDIPGFCEPHAIAEISTAVCSWTRVRHLSVGTLSQAALKHVATLPTLEWFSLKDSTSLEPCLSFPTLCPFPSFPALRQLLIYCQDPWFCINLLKSMAPGSALRAVDLESYSPPATPSDWQILAETLHSVCLHPAVEKLCIKDTPDSGIGRGVKPDLVPLPFDVLKPLLPFTNLSSIDLFAEVGFDLDDITLNTMAMSWPHFTSFRVEGGPYRDIIPRPTFLSLVSFAQHCKHLEVLTLAFNGRTVPSHSATIRDRSKSHPLLILDVGCSPINDPIAVGDLLYHLFPRIGLIQNVETDFRDGVDEEDLWSETELEKKWTNVETFISTKPKARLRKRGKR